MQEGSTPQVKASAAGKMFKDISDMLASNGTPVSSLDDGQLRRFFNEAIKNSSTKEENEKLEVERQKIKEANKTRSKDDQLPEPKSKARILHDTMSPEMSAFGSRLEGFIRFHTERWTDKISDEFLKDFESVFNDLSNELKNSDEWKEFWKNPQPPASPERIAEVQERILMAYRFKMFQMITGEMKTAKVKKDTEDNKTVMVPKYDIKKVASLDIVLQKLNGAYDRKKEKTLREQFELEYKNESGPSYVVDLNMMLAEAIKMRSEGKPKKVVDEYITKERERIRDELIKKDKYAIHIDPEKAKKNFDDLFPAKLLIGKVENYNQACAEVGADINTLVRIMTGVKETQKPDSKEQARALEHKDVLVVEDYIKMLKAKAYIKEYENSKNEDIFIKFDEQKFAKLREQVQQIINDNPAVKANMEALIRADLFAAAREGNYARFKGLVEMGANLETTELNEKNAPVTAFEIILPKLTAKQLKSLIEDNKDIARLYSAIKRNDDFIGKAFQAAHEGNLQALKVFVQSGVNITLENKNGESILDIVKAKYPEKQAEIDKLIEIASKESDVLDLDNPQQYKVLTAYAKDVHVLEYFDFKDALENAQKLAGGDRINATKELLEDYIYGLDENIIALNLEGGGTPARIVELRDELRKYQGKLDTLNKTDADNIIKLCQELDDQYSKYLLNKGGQLPNENSRQIVSSKYPVHKYLELHDKYKEGTQSDRNYAWNAVKKHADFNSKNLEGITPLQMATQIAIKTGKKELMAKVLDGGAKTTEYKRGFLRRVQDAFKGFPKNQLKAFNEAPPRTIAEIQKISGKDFDIGKMMDNLIEKEKSNPTIPKVVAPTTEKVTFAEQHVDITPEKPKEGPRVESSTTPLLLNLESVLSEQPHIDQVDVGTKALEKQSGPPFAPQVESSMQPKPKSDGVTVQQWLDYLGGLEKSPKAIENTTKDAIKRVLEPFKDMNMSDSKVSEKITKAMNSLPAFMRDATPNTKQWFDGIKDKQSPPNVGVKEGLVEKRKQTL